MIKTADSSAVFLLEEKNAVLGDSGPLRFINREEAIERDPAQKGVDGIYPSKDKISSLLASRFSLPKNKKGRYLSISLCFKPNYF
ncbi:hypothetical protein M445_06995 [Vibrio owensii 47666-1]|nr:hypothetical protein M445_06995 [Vibrio owensii 47666-1]